MKIPKQKSISPVRMQPNEKDAQNLKLITYCACADDNVEGVPEMEDLERILKSIGGVDR